MSVKSLVFAREKIIYTGVKNKKGVQNPKKVVKRGSEKRFCSLKKNRNMAKNGFHANFWFHIKKNTELNRLLLKCFCIFTSKQKRLLRFQKRRMSDPDLKI